MTEQQNEPIQADDDVVEGHRLAPPRSTASEDDVEGHRLARPRPTVQPDFDEDDVAGHVAKY